MTLAVEILVWVSVAIALLSAWLMLRMRDEYQMMHFMASPASISVILITVAIFIQQGLKPEAFKAAFITVVLVMMNAVVTHATARAFRIREFRPDWYAGPGREVPLRPTDERMPEQEQR
jgi:multisubunit Na+/H+ antiporter MnhG subunit